MRTIALIEVRGSLRLVNRGENIEPKFTSHTGHISAKLCEDCSVYSHAGYSATGMRQEHNGSLQKEHHNPQADALQFLLDNSKYIYSGNGITVDKYQSCINFYKQNEPSESVY